MSRHSTEKPPEPLRPSQPFLLGVAALLALHLAIYLTHLYAMATYPFQIDYGEGAVLLMAKAFAHGEAAYRDFRQVPFWNCPYAPITPWVGSFMPDFGFGRFICGLGCLSLVLSGWVSLGWRNRGLVFAALFLANPVVLRWTTLYRVDSLGLLFTGLGLLLAMCPLSKRGGQVWLRDGVIALFFVLAFFNKQTFVSAPVAVGATWLWLDRSRGLRFGVLFASMLGAGLALVGALYGSVFYELAFRNNAHPFSALQFWLYLKTYLPVAFPLIILAIVSPAPAIARVYGFLSLWILIGSGRYGADYNYFLETHLALCLMASFLAAPPAPEFSPGRRQPGGVESDEHSSPQTEVGRQHESQMECPAPYSQLGSQACDEQGLDSRSRDGPFMAGSVGGAALRDGPDHRAASNLQ